MSKNVCVPCADKIVSFYEFYTMYLESDRKLREMVAAKNEPSLSTLMPFIKDEFEGGTQKPFDGDSQVFTWVCNKCPARYRTRQHLRQHKRIHRKRFDGDDGYVKLEQSDNWMGMLSSGKTTGDEKEITNYQPEVILSIADDDPTKKLLIKVDKVWRCSKCLADFQTRRQLREHRRSHRLEELTKRGTANEHGALITHQIKVESTVQNPCSQNNSLILAGNEQGEIIDNNELSKWKCRVCLKTFKTRDFLRKHKQIHRNNKSKLDATFKHAESEQDKWLCHLCLSPFATRNQLREHKQEHRNQKKADESGEFTIDTNVNMAKFSCDYCNLLFNSNEEMTNHMESHNSIIKSEESNVQQSFKCQECGRLFNDQYHWKLHMKRHDAERRTTNSTRTILANERIDLKFVCQVCSKGFTRNDNLKAHMYTHTQQYPHRCNYCGAGFVRRYKLRNHEEKCPENPLNRANRAGEP